MFLKSRCPTITLTGQSQVNKKVRRNQLQGESQKCSGSSPAPGATATFTGTAISTVRTSLACNVATTSPRLKRRRWSCPRISWNGQRWSRSSWSAWRHNPQQRIHTMTRVCRPGRMNIADRPVMGMSAARLPTPKNYTTKGQKDGAICQANQNRST